MDMPASNSTTGVLEDEKPPSSHTSTSQPFADQESIVEAAEGYNERGLRPVPVKPKSKKPSIMEWPSFQCPGGEEAKHFSIDGNVSILTGQVSNRLVDIDLDTPRAITLAKYFLPETGFIFGRESARASHYFYYLHGGGLPNKKFAAKIDGKDTTLLELRFDKHYTVVPPSIHEGTGEHIRFEPGKAGMPGHVAGDELLVSVRHLAVTALLSLTWPSKGSRNDFALALAGGLHAKKVDLKSARKIVLHAAKWANDEEAEKRAQTVTDTYKNAEDEEMVTGWPTLKEFLGSDGPHVVSKLKDWLGGDEIHKSQRKPASEFMVTAPQLADLDVPPREDFVEPWMKRGSLILVYAAAKVGKTWFALDLSASLALKRDFIVWKVPKARRVLYVDGEMPLQELQDRVQRLVSGTDRFVTLPSQSLHNGGESPLNLITKRDQDWLDDAIQEVNADVVILDTLSSLTSGWDENANSSPELARLQEWLITLRHMGKSVVIFHHSGHSNRNPRGASRLEWFVDTVIKLDRENLDEGQFVVTFPRLRGEPPKPSSLAVGLTDHGEFWSLDPITNPSPDHRVEILMLVASGNVKTQQQIADHLCRSAGWVSGEVKKLRQHDLLIKGKGLSLTKKGKKFVQDHAELSSGG